MFEESKSGRSVRLSHGVITELQAHISQYFKNITNMSIWTKWIVFTGEYWDAKAANANKGSQETATTVFVNQDEASSEEESRPSESDEEYLDNQGMSAETGTSRTIWARNEEFASLSC